VEEGRGADRSIIVIMGETRPAEQAAAVISEVTRHGRFLVLYSDLKGMTDFAGGGRGVRTEEGGGGKSVAFSLSDPSRPFRSRLRVITCTRLGSHQWTSSQVVVVDEDEGGYDVLW